MWIFCHLMWKTFCHFYRANSIKTDILTCKLWTKWSVSYEFVDLFWLNYFWHWMWNFFYYFDRANSNLKIDIFDIACEKYSRGNAFSATREGSVRKGFDCRFLPGSGLFGSCNSNSRLLAKSWNHIVKKPFFTLLGPTGLLNMYKGSLRNTNFLPMICFTNRCKTFLQALFIKFT